MTEYKSFKDNKNAKFNYVYRRSKIESVCCGFRSSRSSSMLCHGASALLTFQRNQVPSCSGVKVPEMNYSLTPQPLNMKSVHSFLYAVKD